jgi:hypothetical protein
MLEIFTHHPTQNGIIKIFSCYCPFKHHQSFLHSCPKSSFSLFSTPSPFLLFCTIHCVPHSLLFPFLSHKVLSFFVFLKHSPFLSVFSGNSCFVYFRIHLNTISYSFINCGPSVIYSLFYEGAINKSQKLVIYFSLAHNGTVFLCTVE